MTDLEKQVQDAAAEGKEVNLSAIAGPKEETNTLKVYDLYGINPKKVRYYTPNGFKTLPKSEWPVFKYKPAAGLDWQMEFVEANRGIPDFDSVNSMSDLEAKEDATLGLFKKTKFILKKCLKGWSNFLDDEKEPIPFDVDSNGEPTDETLGNFGELLAIEIASAIAQGLKLSKEERTGLKL